MVNRDFTHLEVCGPTDGMVWLSDQRKYRTDSLRQNIARSSSLFGEQLSGAEYKFRRTSRCIREPTELFLCVYLTA